MTTEALTRPRRRRGWNKKAERNNLIIQQWNEGCEVPDIAAYHNISVSRVYQLMDAAEEVDECQSESETPTATVTKITAQADHQSSH